MEGEPILWYEKIVWHKVLRRMAYGLKKEEVTGGLRKWQYGEIHNLLFSVVY
jgi:hypothetical protein